MNRTTEFNDKKTGWRSRGWTPLKYPKSAIVRNENNESFAYFPLHQDVLLASVRELLVIDGTIDGRTLKVTKKKVRFLINEESVSVPCYQRHMEAESWPLAADGDEDNKKRRKAQMIRKKKTKIESAQVDEKQEDVDSASILNEKPAHSPLEIEDTQDENQRPPLAEQVAMAIVFRSRITHSLDRDGKKHPGQSTERIERPPRKVSEADQSPSYSQLSPRREPSPLPMEEDMSIEESQEISEVIDFSKRNTNGSFCMRHGSMLWSMVHASIPIEALLRDAAMSMTQQLIATFSNQALRMFLGYKAPAITRDRLTQLLAGFLFDTSHAAFAWEQTELEILARSPQTASIDSMVQNSLFDDRALKKIGGFDPSSLLPHALSIGRLRRRNSSWEYHATTAQGKRMLNHHAREKAMISVGKQRRGQRLRQRYWLTSALLSHEHDCDSTEVNRTRSRSCSFASSEGEEDPMLANGIGAAGKCADLNRRSRILADVPGSKAISLVKQPPNKSWGVCLAKEGMACVVGRAKERPTGSRADEYLRCGDLILYAQNESGKEAFSPLCVWFNTGSSNAGEEDFFRAMVDLFKTSEELHLVVQRV